VPTAGTLGRVNVRNLPGMNLSATIRAFVAIVYALSIILSLVVGLTGGYESPLVGLRFLSVFIPAVTVLIVSSAIIRISRLTGTVFQWGTCLWLCCCCQSSSTLRCCLSPLPMRAGSLGKTG
jgi:hypothetical protein